MATKTADLIASGAPDQVKQFTYKARNADGKEVTGVAKATTKTDVTKELLFRGLVPLSVSSPNAGGLSLQTEITLRRTAKKRDLVLATRQMAAMLDSGLSYIEAIDVVKNECEDTVLKNALTEVRLAISNGSTMSAALAAQGEVFPPVMINLITSGEAGGQVKQSMNRVADQFDAEDQLRAKIKKAMMYPAVVFVLSGVVFVVMMLFLVPSFASTFEEIGGPGTELPALTRAVVAVSDAMRWLLPAFAMAVVPGWIWYRRIKHRPKVREFVDPLKLRLPIFGNLFHKIALARFTRNLSGLLGAGVERLQALTIAAETVGNIKMERAIIAAREAQRRGQPLVEPLRAEPLFPGMVIQMVEAGERSGRTAYMLEKAADIYDRDVDQITDNMSALIEPLFLVGLGVMVGTLVIAIYLPYLSIGNII
ncbi:type II secretion system F family protein [Nocardioides pakistanensis]